MGNFDPPENLPFLVEQIRGSDQQAFRKLYEHYYTPMYRFIWRRVRNDALAEDLIQDLFLKIWNARGKLDPQKSFEAYLFRIALNLCNDVFRRKAVRKQTSLEAIPFEPVDNDSVNDLKTSVWQLLNRLPEEIRQVFVLKRFEGFRNHEVADILKIAEKTVEGRMTRALKYLRRELYIKK